MKNFFKVTALALCISASPLCLAQGADAKGWAKQIIEAQRGMEQTGLLYDLTGVISVGMIDKWGKKVIEEVSEDKRESVAKQVDDLLKEYREDVFNILKKESLNVEEKDLPGVYTQHFTPEELKAIAQWYTSPAYRKLQEKTPVLAEAYLQKLEERSKKALEARQGKFDSKVQSIIKAANK